MKSLNCVKLLNMNTFKYKTKESSTNFFTLSGAHLLSF